MFFVLLGVRDANAADLQKAVFCRYGHGKFGAIELQVSLKTLITFIEIEKASQVEVVAERIIEMGLQLYKTRVEASCSLPGMELIDKGGSMTLPGHSRVTLTSS